MATSRTQPHISILILNCQLFFIAIESKPTDPLEWMYVAFIPCLLRINSSMHMGMQIPCFRFWFILIVSIFSIFLLNFCGSGIKFRSLHIPAKCSTSNYLTCTQVSFLEYKPLNIKTRHYVFQYILTKGDAHSVSFSKHKCSDSVNYREKLYSVSENYEPISPGLGPLSHTGVSPHSLKIQHMQC